MNKIFSISFWFVIIVVLGAGINNAYASVPSITRQPANVTVTAPATATFTITATGTPTPTYQWKSEVSGDTSYTSISGATSASYTTPATTTANSGTKYECVATNSAGSATSSAATLTVNPAPVAPTITTQPSNATVTVPATATFTITATGTPAPTYQWKSEASGGTSYSSISGATSTSYTTPATTIANSGTKYECVVTNSAGNVTSSAATLTVNPASVAPTITTQPSNATVTAPATATFTITATGTPTPTYQWQSEASGAASYTAVGGATSAGFTTLATTTANSGTNYECVVTNSAGSVTSNPVSLTVSPAAAPVITITSPGNNSAFTVGSNLTISASASESFGTISSVTFYNGTTLLGSTTTSPYTYTLNNLSAGTYTLTASALDISGVTTVSSLVNVTVVAAPPGVTIASPVNNSVLTTGSVNITAITQGTVYSVAFYNGAALLGTVFGSTQSITCAPGTFDCGLNGTLIGASQVFTYSWTNVPAGTYILTAVTSNNAGATLTSAPVSFTINSANFTNAVDDDLLTKTDALNHTTSFQYDNLNRLLGITFADTSTVAYAYDLFGNQVSVTDQRGNKLTKTYDAYDRLSQTKDPNGGITQFNYDTDSRLLQLTDANGNNTSYTYDPNGKVLTQANALNFTTAFTYDPVGNVATRTDANGKATTYAYDALNRLTSITYPNSTQVINTYDALGRKISMNDFTGQTAYTYDALSRLLSKSNSVFYIDPLNGGTQGSVTNSIVYTYDSEGNRLTSVDQSNRTITNTYDALNRLSSVQDPNGTTSYGYDALSNESTVTSPNGVIESYTYDALNRVLSANVYKLNGILVTYITSFVNVYDIAGMITKKTLLDGSWTAYTYDALNQLLSETKQTSSSVLYGNVYSYDAVGNRLSLTKNTTLGEFWSVDYLNMPSQVLTNMSSGGYGSTANQAQAVSLVRSYTNDAANRLTGWNYAVNVASASYPVQTDTYAYDNNGNRLTKQAVLTGQSSTPQQTNYSYDFENRLNQLQYTNIPNITGTQTDYLFYNGEGLRTQANIANVFSGYFYDGSNISVEQDVSGNTTKTYTRAVGFPGGINGMIAQNTTGANAAVQYYGYDDLGSTANLTTSTGTTATSYNYDAYGNLLTTPASSDTNRYFFSTKEFDTRSGLDYFGARYYDPEIGRWLTPDPLGFVDGPNTYIFVNNDAINFIDPLGLWYLNIGLSWGWGGGVSTWGIIFSDKGTYEYSGAGGGTWGGGGAITWSPDEPTVGWNGSVLIGTPLFVGGGWGETDYQNGDISHNWEVGLTTPGVFVGINYVQPFQWPWVTNKVCPERT